MSRKMSAAAFHTATPKDQLSQSLVSEDEKWNSNHSDNRSEE